MDMTFTFPGGSRVDGQVGRFTIFTDQPPNATAPSPFTLFLASIGACAGVYVLAFCRRRDIPTDHIRVVQRNVTDDDGMVSAVDITVELPSDFPEQYRDAVIRAADRCTVKLHLAKPPRINVVAASPAQAEAGI
jgi:putative redox protein